MTSALETLVSATTASCDVEAADDKGPDLACRDDHE